jgi:hypothetical protein
MGVLCGQMSSTPLLHYFSFLQFLSNTNSYSVSSELVPVYVVVLSYVLLQLCRFLLILAIEYYAILQKYTLLLFRLGNIISLKQMQILEETDLFPVYWESNNVYVVLPQVQVIKE